MIYYVINKQERKNLGKSLVVLFYCFCHFSIDQVRMETINTVLARYNGHYAPAHRCISRALDVAMADYEKESEFVVSW